MAGWLACWLTDWLTAQKMIFIALLEKQYNKSIKKQIQNLTD
jgi:hypothetical protein